VAVGVGVGVLGWARWRVEVVRARWEGVRVCWRCGRFNGDREGGDRWVRDWCRSARRQDAQTEDAAIAFEWCDSRNGNEVGVRWKCCLNRNIEGTEIWILA